MTLLLPPAILALSFAGPVRVTQLAMRTRLQMAASELPTPDDWAVQRLKDGGARVGSNSLRFRAVDVDMVVPRSPESPGIGLGLEELGSDGEIGLVLVDTVVEGGNAAKASSPFLVGDALISVRDAAGDLEDVRLEGATYDDTVAALGALPAALGDLIFTVRRLERQATVNLRLQFEPSEKRADEQLVLLPGQPLRQTILARGIKLNDPLALRFDSGGPGDCGGEGCCCTCAVQVVSGQELLSGAKTQEKQMLRKHPDWRLGARAHLRGYRGRWLPRGACEPARLGGRGGGGVRGGGVSATRSPPLPSPHWRRRRRLPHEVTRDGTAPPTIERRCRDHGAHCDGASV